MNKSAILLSLALFGATAAAQDNAGGDDTQLRRYAVEIIVFSYAQGVGTGSEIFVPDAPPAEPFEDLADNGRSEPEATRRVAEISRLRRSEYSLDDVYGHIKRLDVYEPLMHFGWIQQTLPEEEAVARPLSSFDTPPPGLNGELTLYLGRYLHLNIDLQLDAPAATQAPNVYANRERRDGAFRDPGDIDDHRIRYRINENRIIRNGDLRYFDHPKFGVLAKITRVEDEDDDPLDEPELFSDRSQ